ncbi:unnamed protein product [Brassica oleracea var. botrytis]|uniref:Copine C-terminal domain-containing protein n=2 Tax=Brassica oleracea TaxID=3712 RepID=A0A0D3A8F0_BRAOL|nr:unnamed protein product [Brassica oleracea]
MSRKVESVDMLLLGEKSTLIKEPSEPTTSPCFDIVSVAMTKKSSVSTVIRGFAMTKREFSQEDKATIDAIVNQSSYALSIVLVSVVDRPLADVRKFNDMIPKPDFKIMKRNSSELAKETAFALPALNYRFCDAPVAISFTEQT